MNRNITIVVIILILVVIAGYLVWLRSNYQTQVTTPEVSVEEIVPEVASPSATLSPTPSKGQTATSGATTR